MSTIIANRWETINGAASGVLYVNTLEELKSASTDSTIAGQACLITSTERAGNFVWVASNRSSEVSNDPKEAIWVAPEGEDGSTGAWLRRYDGLFSGVSIGWFKLPGDVDDTDAIEAALNYGKPVYGNSQTFSISRELNFNTEFFELYDATIDTTAIPDPVGGAASYAIDVIGSQSAPINITAAIAKGDTLITVADTTPFTDGGWFTIESQELWDTTVNARKGITLQVEEIVSATQIRLTHPIIYSFDLIDDPVIRVLTTVKRPIVRNVNFIGDSAKFQAAIRCFYFQDGDFERISTKGFGYGGIVLSRCINTTIDRYTAKEALTAGFAYGVVIIDTCYGITIKNGVGDELRHYVTVGGSNGVNVNIKMINNDCYNCTDSGLDSHPAGDHILYSGNTISMKETSSGLMHQGKNAIIIGNHIYGGLRAVRAQGLTIGDSYALTIADNHFYAAEDGSTQQGVLIETHAGAGASIRAAGLDNNTYRGFFSGSPMLLVANSGDISNVSIIGEKMDRASGGRPLSIRPQNGAKIEAVQVSACTLRSATDYVIWLFGDSGGDLLKTINLSGNNLIGGDSSIYARFVNGLMDRGNLAVDFVTAKYNIGSSTNLDTEQP